MKSFLIADSNKGVYCAQHIAQNYGKQIQGMSEEDVDILWFGPYHEDYTETAEMLLDTGVFIEFEGDLYHIDTTESGDWFAVHPEEFSHFYSEVEEENENIN